MSNERYEALKKPQAELLLKSGKSSAAAANPFYIPLLSREGNDQR